MLHVTTVIRTSLVIVVGEGASTITVTDAIASTLVGLPGVLGQQDEQPPMPVIPVGTTRALLDFLMSCGKNLGFRWDHSTNCWLSVRLGMPNYAMSPLQVRFSFSEFRLPLILSFAV